MHDDHEKPHRDGRIPDALWERIKPLLPPRKPHPLGCHRLRVEDRQAMDAIFFVLRTGSQWNALKATGLCCSRSAHRRFQEWTAADVFLALWKQGLEADEAFKGIDWEWLAMDRGMTKAPLGGGNMGARIRPTGQDWHQAHVLTDGGGVPVGLAVEGANRHDFKTVRETIESIPIVRPEPSPDNPQGMCLDTGDDDDEVREVLAKRGFTAHIRARGEAAQALTREAGDKARRWVVERTHRGMNRFRRVLVRWDKNGCHYLAWRHLACASITYRPSGLWG
jgi:putative transposase